MNFINVSEPKKMNSQLNYDIDLVHLQYAHSSRTVLAPFHSISIPLSVGRDEQGKKPRYYEHLFLD